MSIQLQRNIWVMDVKDNYASCHGNIVMKFKLAKDMKSVSDRTDIVKDIEYKPFKSDQPSVIQVRTTVVESAII